VIWVPNATQLLEVHVRSGPLIRPIPRDLGLIESALQRANLTMYGTELYADVHTKVAAVIDSIARTHPLLDGNKRLSVVATFVIFTMNGCSYAGQDKDADFYVAIAAEQLSLEAIADQLRELWVPAEPSS
jgi:death-on-curing protein